MGVCTKERKGVTAEVLMATPCTNSLGGESGEHKHEGCGGRRRFLVGLSFVCVLLVSSRDGALKRKGEKQKLCCPFVGSLPAASCRGAKHRAAP